MKITKEYLDNVEWLKHDEKDEYRLRAVLNNSDFVKYESTDGMVTIQNLIGNLSQDSWVIHLDNNDYNSIAVFDVETVEDANTIFTVYNKYLINTFTL